MVGSQPPPPPPMINSFTVRKQKPEMVRPASPTPQETKSLSDLDDQRNLHFVTNGISFYKRRGDPDGRGISRISEKEAEEEEEDPVKVIKAALAETLVLYYPFAGRLIEGPGSKLVVDYTGDGVFFVEADADVTLQELGEELQPPFPCMEDLLCNFPGTGEILHSPLLSIQVTRLRCGGFIFSYILNHVISDGAGVSQFLMALAEIARGASATQPPVWMREILSARDPPRITFNHCEYDVIPDPTKTQFFLDELVCRSFFFSLAEISALRASLPPHLRTKCTSFDVLTACLWRSRTAALQLDPDQEVRILIVVNARSKFDPPIPEGYYGNVLVTPAAVTTAGKLTENPLWYGAELVMNAKSMVTEEYTKSNMDLIVSRGRKSLTWTPGFIVSDLRRLGFDDVDFGWGKPTYAGPAIGTKDPKPGRVGFYIPRKNKKGEKGVVVPIGLPRFAMKRFIDEIKTMVKGMKDDGN